MGLEGVDPVGLGGCAALFLVRCLIPALYTAADAHSLRLGHRLQR